jgi:hypothetical protein
LCLGTKDLLINELNATLPVNSDNSFKAFLNPPDCSLYICFNSGFIIKLTPNISLNKFCTVLLFNISCALV